uniref:Ig-like domain-containing protein n=1 Tax=Scleropages formosus TaxID=113540 RepID=A0A8C9R034_SCLFO
MVKRIQCRHQSHNGRFTFAFAHSDGAQMGPPASFILGSGAQWVSVCVCSVGGSVELPSALGTVTLNDFFLLQWNFNNSEIARLRNNKTDVEIHTRFRRRLQLSPDFSLTVRELTLQDSGVYRRTGLKAAGGQIPTHTIHLSVYEKITAVQIKSDLTWMPVNETCEVHVMCSSSGDQSASYTWRKGDQTVRGRELHFSLSPAEGGVTVTCTVHNGVSEKSTNDTVMCTFAGDPTHFNNTPANTHQLQNSSNRLICSSLKVHIQY